MLLNLPAADSERFTVQLGRMQSAASLRFRPGRIGYLIVRSRQPVGDSSGWLRRWRILLLIMSWLFRARTPPLTICFRPAVQSNSRIGKCYRPDHRDAREETGAVRPGDRRAKAPVWADRLGPPQSWPIVNSS